MFLVEMYALCTSCQSGVDIDACGRNIVMKERKKERKFNIYYYGVVLVLCECAGDVTNILTDVFRVEDWSYIV
jgi:predicted nucleic acid-binding Zn ribbon protein